MPRAKRRAEPSRPLTPTQQAAKALATFSAQAAERGQRAPDGPTPERLLRARGSARVELGATPVLVDRDGETLVERVETLRVRVTDDPLSVLSARGMLGRDREANRVALFAGRALHEAWITGQLSALRSIDIDATGGGLAVGAVVKTEAQWEALRVYRTGMHPLSVDERRVVQAVAIDEQSPASAGALITGYAAGKQSRAVAMYVLSTGLAKAALALGFDPT